MRSRSSGAFGPSLARWSPGSLGELEARQRSEPEAHQQCQALCLEVTGSRDYRHIVGARERASWPTCRRLSADVSPLVAASRILEATWVRAPIS